MFGFSFLETSIKNPQINKTSAKAIPQVKISDPFKAGTRSILYEDIIEITIHIKKIINLSIVES